MFKFVSKNYSENAIRQKENKCICFFSKSLTESFSMTVTTKIKLIIKILFVFNLGNN